MGFGWKYNEIPHICDDRLGVLFLTYAYQYSIALIFTFPFPRITKTTTQSNTTQTNQANPQTTATRLPQRRQKT